MRRRFGLLWALVTLAVVSAAGWFAYQAGLAEGAATSGHGGAVVNPGYYPYYQHGWGFGFFPVLGVILLLFFLFRRPWGHRHWGGYGGYGMHGGGTPGEGELPPPVDRHMRAWHDKAHGTPSPPDTGPDVRPG